VISRWLELSSSNVQNGREAPSLSLGYFLVGLAISVSTDSVMQSRIEGAGDIDVLGVTWTGEDEDEDDDDGPQLKSANPSNNQMDMFVVNSSLDLSLQYYIYMEGMKYISNLI
jgi:hypothetical protein